MWFLMFVAVASTYTYLSIGLLHVKTINLRFCFLLRILLSSAPLLLRHGCEYIQFSAIPVSIFIDSCKYFITIESLSKLQSIAPFLLCQRRLYLIHKCRPNGHSWSTLSIYKQHHSQLIRDEAWRSVPLREANSPPLLANCDSHGNN